MKGHRNLPVSSFRFVNATTLPIRLSCFVAEKAARSDYLRTFAQGGVRNFRSAGLAMILRARPLCSGGDTRQVRHDPI